MTEAIAQSVEAYRGDNAKLVRFGIPALDDIMPGLYPGELTLLRERSAMCKAAAALTMALNATRAGHGVDIASLEMTPAAMAQRALAEATARDGRAVAEVNMRSGDMTEDQIRAVVELGQSVINLPIIFLSWPCSSVDAFVGGVRQIARANPCRPGRLHLAHAQALKAGRDAAVVLADARMNFESRTGRQRAALAGLAITTRQEFDNRLKADPVAKDDDK